jgi:serine/threonine-protein kinase
MSPEHAQGQPIDFRTDLYAAALIAIFAITGDSGGIDSTSAVHRRVAGDQWMEPLLLEVPESLRGVLVRALARAPERRYGSAASMRADLLRHVPRRARSAEKDVQQRAATQMPRRSGPPTEDMRAGRSSQSDDE